MLILSYGIYIGLKVFRREAFVVAVSEYVLLSAKGVRVGSFVKSGLTFWKKLYRNFNAYSVICLFALMTFGGLLSLYLFSLLRFRLVFSSSQRK